LVEGGEKVKGYRAGSGWLEKGNPSRGEFAKKIERKNQPPNSILKRAVTGVGGKRGKVVEQNVVNKKTQWKPGVTRKILGERGGDTQGKGVSSRL